MSSLLTDLSWVSGGFVPDNATGLLDDSSWADIAAGGVPVEALPPPPVPNQVQNPPVFGDPTTPQAGFRLLDPVALSSIANLRDANGVIVQNPLGYIDLGSGHSLSFDPETTQGRITPAVASSLQNRLDDMVGGGFYSYTGADMTLILEIENPPRLGDSHARYSSQVLECTTLSISIHRVKSAARAAGFIGVKGYARGGRTVAGTIIFTQFTAEVLLRFLQSVLFQDKSKDMHYMKIDQLPPFNISILYTSESGHASYRRLLGLEFVTDGTVYSVQDLMTEQTISYVAADFTPLLPLTLSSLYHPPLRDPSFEYERSPAELFKRASLI